MKKFLLLLLLLGTFTASAQNTDIRWLRAVHVNRNTSLDPIFKGFSNSVYPISAGIPAGFLVHSLLKCDTIRQQRFWLIGGTMAISTGLTLGLKYGINRKRPFVTYPDIQAQQHAGPYSFPSGHTSSAFALATSVTIAFPKWYVAVPAYVWAGSVAYSRMHLGMHYPGDLLGGAIVGAGSAWLSWKLNRWMMQSFAGRLRKNC